MRDTLTISLPGAMRLQMSKAAKRRHLTQSEYVRKAIQDQLWAEAIEESRRQLVPKARAIGIYTDEDVFKIIS